MKSEEINSMKQQLLSLLKKDAFLKKRIKLSSGKISNFYIDIRKVSLSPKGIYLISNLVLGVVKSLKVDAIGGPTLGADPIVGGVCLLAYKKKIPLKGFLIRKTPKKHGRQRLIEGQVIKPYEKVVIVDDVATSGSSLIKSIKILQKEKIKVVGAVTVIDRQEGASDNLAALGCPLKSLFTRGDFLGSSK